MGSSISKSPLERRNTVLRRSQKKVIAQSDGQIERLFKDIRKFKGVDEDENYTKLKNRIEDFKKELARKSKDLVPQVKNLHARAEEKVRQAEALLESKVKENAEKSEEKKNHKEKHARDEAAKGDTQFKKDSEANNNIDEITIEELERQRDNTASPLSNRDLESEQGSLINAIEKRKTVGIKDIKVETEGTSAITQLEKSPQQTRRSVIKYGVQVLPTLNNEMLSRQSMQLKHSSLKMSLESPRSSIRPTIESPRSSISSKQSLSSPKQSRVQTTESILGEILQEIGDLEEQISKFSGKKNGREYNCFKEKLFQNLDKLSSQPDDKSSETHAKVKKYIESCLSFLDEKADTRDDDDDVFLPDDKPNSTINGYKITQI